MSPQSPNAEHRHTPRKRRRVPVACNGCRSRKSRCDGQRPQCSTCVDFEQACIYQSTEPWKTNTSANRETKRLESRLRFLEDRLRILSERKTENDGARMGVDDRLNEKPLSDHQELLQEPFWLGLDVPDLVPSETRPPEDLLATPETESLQHADTAQHSVDGMGTIMRNSAAGNYSFYGPTSNIALIDQIGQNLSQLGCTAPGPGIMESQLLDKASDITPEAFPLASKIEIDIFALPPESEATSLVNNFFRTAGLFVPCLHEESFLDVYNRIWQCDRREISRTWMATLNLVFALSSAGAIPHFELLAMRREGRETDAGNSSIVNTQSEIYYQRALALGNLHLVKNTGLELVQFLVLMETWLQGNQRSLQTWPVHALTAGAALEAGLHCSDTMSGLSVIEQEIRRRVWYCVLINDRFFSVWFGRPSLISPSRTQVSLPRDINFMNPSRLVSSAIASLAISGFRAEIALSEIVSNLVDQLFNQNNVSAQAIPVEEIVSRHSKICWKLAKWQDHLTEPLKLITSLELSKLHASKTTMGNNDGFKVLRFRVYLTMRYLNVRLLLHRSILTNFMKFNKNGSLPISRDCTNTSDLLLEYGSTAFQDCFSCCREIISLVGEILAASSREAVICGAWWLTAYYTFNAALVTFGLLLIDRDYSFGFNPDSMRTTIDGAIAVIQKMEEGNNTIRSCRMYTSYLREAWDSQDAAHGILPSSAFYTDSSTAPQSFQWLREAQPFSHSPPSPSSLNLQSSKPRTAQGAGAQMCESGFDWNFDGFRRELLLNNSV